MKILYYINTLAGGGAARKLALIANEMVKRNHDVSIATNTNFPILYQLNENIRIIPLYDDNSYNISRAKRLLRQILNARKIALAVRPDVIVTILPAVSFYTKLATLGLGIPVIFSDETSFARKDTSFVHFVRFHFYKLADAVVLLTDNDTRILGNRIPKKVVISNPLSYPVFHGTAERRKTILATGPTNEWNIKGFDLLIEAFGTLSAKHPDWELNIAGATGENSLRQLQQIIKKCNVQGKVHFIGFQSHIDQAMRNASVFALSSRIEGFSLSLVEALSQGCPAVAFRIKGVIADVTGNGNGTLLTDDYSVRQFAENLDRLMSDPSLRQRLADDGREYVKKYSIDKIVDQWEQLFDRLIKKTDN